MAPQPINRPTLIDHGPRAVLSRPAVGIFLAAISVEWTMIEQHLAELLGLAFGNVRWATGGGMSGFVTKPNTMLSAVIENVESIHARLKLMDATLGKLVLGSSMAQPWEDLKKNLRGRAKERNKAVHGVWAASDEYPDDLLLIDDEVCYRYRQQDLNEVLSRLIDTDHACFNFSIGVKAALQAGEIKEGSFGPTFSHGTP